MILPIFLFIIGLFFGSFFGVLVDRIPKGKSFVKGRSYCDFCKKTLGWKDLIPVISFIATKGKCRYCHKSLPYFYPIIELVTGLLFAFVYYFSNFQFSIFNFQLIYNLIVVSGFIVIFFTDLKYGIIPDGILLVLALTEIIFLLISGSWMISVNHVVSAVLSFAFFIAINYTFYFVTKKEGMGGGDIKLSFVLGLLLGFPGIFVGLYLAFLTGALVSTILVLWRKRLVRDRLAFGPFLIFGAFAGLFWGAGLYSFFLKLLGA